MERENNDRTSPLFLSKRSLYILFGIVILILITITLIVVRSSPPTNTLNLTSQPLPLTLMTFNVQFYTTSRSTALISKFINDRRPDVVCIQENINSHDWNETSFVALNLNHSYLFAAECQAEKVNRFHLSNTKHIHRKHSKHVQTLAPVNLRIGNETPRCAAVLRLYDTKIANVHLCGGRFDDKKYRQLQHNKGLQLQRLISTHDPDIIIGDFNSENSDAVAMKQLDRYSFYHSLTADDRTEFFRYFMSGAHYLRDRTAYVPAYNESVVGVTSVYGGTPDWIYVKNYSRLTGRIDNDDTVTMNLSDHRAVTVEYLFHHPHLERRKVHRLEPARQVNDAAPSS